MNNQRNSKAISMPPAAYNVFIPFIRLGVTDEDIRRVFSKKQLGQIRSVDMHEKKIQKSGGGLRSANHYYAFITVTPMRTEAGEKFITNILAGLNTHVMYNDCDLSVSWDVKPHLSVRERTDRGFTLLPSTEKIEQSQISNIPNQTDADLSTITTDSNELNMLNFIDSDHDDESLTSAKEDDDYDDGASDYIEDEEEDDDKIPEWMNDDSDDGARIYTGRFGTDDSKISAPSKYTETSIVRNLCNEFSAEPIHAKQSVFDSLYEKMEIMHDYNMLNSEIQHVQQKIRYFNMWESIEFVN